MVRIEEGGTYTAAIARTGVSSRGDWELVQVRDKGVKGITIWPENKPTGIQQGDEFIVEKITAVKFGARQIKGEWKDDISVEAVLRKTTTVNNFEFDIDNFADDAPADSNPFGNQNLIDLGDDDGTLPF